MSTRAIALAGLIASGMLACQSKPSASPEPAHAGSEGEHDHAGEGHDDADHDEAKPDGRTAPRQGGHDDHGNGEEDEGVVKLSAEAIRRSGIRVAPAAQSTLRDTVDVAAEVQFNPDKVAHINPLVEGQLLSVTAAIGDAVEPDQALATLRSVALGQARAELSRTIALLRVARQTLTRQKKLRAEGINSERDLLAAQLTFNQADAERDAARSRITVFGVGEGRGPDMALTSPIAGVVVERHATRGENVGPDDTLFIVADLSRMWVIGQVYEQQIAQVQPGMQATLTLNAYPSRSWTGTVDFVGAVVAANTRTLPIRVEIDNPDGRLRPGLFGNLRLSSAAEAGGTTVVVPQTAIQTMDNQSVVFVPGHAAGEFERLVVTVGREANGQVEILQGLSSGRDVVVEGGFILKSELMRGQLGHGHAH